MRGFAPAQIRHGRHYPGHLRRRYNTSPAVPRRRPASFSLAGHLDRERSIAAHGRDTRAGRAVA